MKPAETAIEPLLADIGEVALALRLGTSSVRKLIMNGELPSVRIGDRRLVRVEDLQAFAERVGAQPKAIHPSASTSLHARRLNPEGNLKHAPGNE
jgi:excisionase family DNA binding protein